jgi:hypothetical protein
MGNSYGVVVLQGARKQSGAEDLIGDVGNNKC